MILIVALLFIDPSDRRYSIGSDSDIIRESEKRELQGLDEKLDELNQKNNFSDTNMVAKEIKQLEDQEMTACGYFAKCFLTLCGVFFTIKLSLEYFLISATAFASRRDFRELNSTAWIAQLFQCCSFICGSAIN
jgi:hypothetical protein